MGDLFDALIRFLGTVLAFFFDVLDTIFSTGAAMGLSIVLLTISINIVVFPLTLKQTRATRAFSTLQPKLKKIQEQHKDDKEEMQRQMMEAQKEAGATPIGCLIPLLVQMPVWFALFRMLRAPETYIPSDSALHDAVVHGGNSFLGMLLNVSPSTAVSDFGFPQAIPYLFMIVLMVATQYTQQWHATYGQVRDKSQPGAGAQQAVTKIMPLFIGFISWNFPAGLIVYWATSNLFRLGQQFLIFRIDGRPPSPGSQSKGPDKPKDQPDGNGSENGQPKPQQGAANKRRRRRRR